MNTLLVLQNRAIKAAQEERWIYAQSLNQEILNQYNLNISALNRLGFAYLQDNKTKEAKRTYEQVLELDKANAVAKKYLDILARKQPIKLPKALKHSDFIDEPGKTKSVQLVRLAEPEVISELSIGADCQLQATKTRISVQCERKYIGSLPDDITQRIQPLIEAGNSYTTKIQSLKNNTVTIFVRELARAGSVAHITSFPTDNLSVLAIDHTEVARDEESPVYVAETESDEGSSMLNSGDIDEALDISDDGYADYSEESIDEDE